MNGNAEAKMHFERGKALRERSLWLAACAEFEKASEADPEGAELLVEWGRALYGREDFRRAADCDRPRD